MQNPQNDTPIMPDRSRPPVPPAGQMEKPGRQPRPRHGRFRRFVRGYLMMVGGLTTLYVLVQLLVRLFVEIGKWSSGLPIG